MDILALNGPNLNLLGLREQAIYGQESLEEINATLEKQASNLGIGILCRQSNSESQLIEYIHDADSQGVRFILFNPAAFTHTSIALRDAILGVDIPFIELHLSNIYAREDFRKESMFSDIACGVICGFGSYSYRLAFEFAAHFLQTRSKETRKNGYT